MGPTWALSAPDGPHVGFMILAIRVDILPGGYEQPVVRQAAGSGHRRAPFPPLSGPGLRVV